MRYALLVTVGMLVSCASVQPHEFRGPSGKTAYSMRCSGMGRSLDECYKKAGELCPTGYNIVDRTTATVGVPVNGGTMIAPQNTLAIECK